VTHLKANEDGSVSFVADHRIFPRALVKSTAAAALEFSHVLLDLDDAGDIIITVKPLDDEVSSEVIAGQLGNVLVSELARKKMDAQALTSRDLILARALDGALPRRGVGETAALGDETSDSSADNEADRDE
jgi:hypothetical protein